MQQGNTCTARHLGRAVKFSAVLGVASAMGRAFLAWITWSVQGH